MTAAFKRGTPVTVPWGLGTDREGTVVEVWGDPHAPSQLRIEMVPVDEDDIGTTLLIGPDVVTRRS